MAENYYLNHTATQIDAILTKVDGIAAGANVNVQVDWNQTTTTADDYIKNKPAIPDAQIQSDWEQTNTESKDFIKNKPTIPAAQVNSDWEASSGVAQILNKPTLGTAAAKGVDSSPTASSTNLVESGGVYTAISAKADEPWQGTRAQYEALQTDDYEYYMVIETPNNQSLNSNSLSSFASSLTHPQTNDYMNTPGLVDESDQVGETE